MTTTLLTKEEYMDKAYQGYRLGRRSSLDLFVNEDKSAKCSIVHQGDEGALVRVEFFHNGELCTVIAQVNG